MHVVVGDKNPDSALVGEAGHDGLNVFYRDGVYAGKGLVEQYKLGVGGQASSNLGTPALAAGEQVASGAANLG